MSNINVWEKYEKLNTIEFGSYGDIYKVRNKQTGYYYTIKEIKKEIYNQSKNILLKKIEIMKKIKNENIISIKELIDNEEYFYIVMDLYEYNLEDYIKRREDSISVNEVREILIQLNKTFKKILKENITHINLHPKNILISVNKLDKCLIKLSNYGEDKYINSIKENEFVENGNHLVSFDIFDLGIIIYLMLFKEYPNKIKKITFLNNSNSIKQVKLTDNEQLNDLLDKMLQVNVNERISWDDYFEHSFFKQKDNKNLSLNNNKLLLNSNKFSYFNFKCNKHYQNVSYYCQNCKLNICEFCLKEHKKHLIISFSKIGLNNEEITTIDHLLNEIEKNINLLNKIKKDIELFFNEMKLIKENISIYKNDNKNNYKEYYIDYLRYMEKRIKIEEMKIIDLEGNKGNYNYINCEYHIKKNEINKPIKILNSYDNIKKEVKWLDGVNNEKEIKDNCEIYLNDKKIDFCYEFKFPKEGKYTIKIVFLKVLTNTNYMFSQCSSLTSLNLSNLNTDNVFYMREMFSKCSSLTNLNLSNINTENVTDMEYMFYKCSSLVNLDLSSFFINNVSNMRYMFCECTLLTSLNLSNFSYNIVTDMRGMFSNCYSLNSLNLSNFNTDYVTNMREMFYNCTSINSLNLIKFNTKNVINMKHMFYKCYSLTNLNLTNFNTNNVVDMNSMFSDCTSLISLNLLNFNTKKVTDMSYMFYKCSSLSFLNLSNFNTNNVTNMRSMFHFCSSLTSLKLTNFNTNNVVDMNCMFSNCSSLNSLDLSNFDTQNVIEMGGMFFKCLSLTSLNLSNFVTNKVIDMSNMFSNCSSLKDLDLSNFYINNLTDIKNTFSGLHKKCKIKLNEEILKLLK